MCRGRSARNIWSNLPVVPACALMAGMTPKYHPTPLSGGDRKALAKELARSKGMTVMLARQSDELRAQGEELIQRADKLLCESWNERMWSMGGPIDPSPTIVQAINGGFLWLEVQCSRCKTLNSVDLCALRRPASTFVHDLAGRLRCKKCDRAGKRPSASLLQLGWSARYPPPGA